MKNFTFLTFFLVASLTISAQSTDLPGFYKCSKEDMIRLNSDGTGKLYISYVYDGILQFKWKYDKEYENVSVELVLTEEQKWQVALRYITLSYFIRGGRKILAHPQGPITYEYIKE